MNAREGGPLIDGLQRAGLHLDEGIMRSSAGSSPPHPDLYSPLAVPLMPALRIIDGCA